MNEFLNRVQTEFAAASPLLRELRYSVVQLRSGVAVAYLPYSADLVGDPFTGVIHGGAVTTLLDSTGAIAVLAALQRPVPMATLDLRIDYLHASAEGSDVYAKVECYRWTRDVAFTRGVAYDRELDDPVASMAATYILQTPMVRVEARDGG